MSSETSDLPFELVQDLVDVRGLLGQLHERTLAHLFGATVTVAAAVKALDKLKAKERDSTVERVRRALRARRVDRDDLEGLASTHSVAHDKKTPSDLLVLLLAEKMGAAKFDAKAEELLVPMDYLQRGTFGTFDAPVLPANLNAATVAHELEMAVEKHLSHGRDKRRARVRAIASDEGFVVVVYFERPHLDGRKIDGKKHLRAEMFERPAADTFFWLHRLPGKARLVQKMGGRKLAGAIRTALGKVIWRDEMAVSGTTIAAYDLQKALAPTFVLTVISDSLVRACALHEIELRVPSGNMVRLKASGESHDVLPDLKRFAMVEQGAIVTSLVVKLTVDRPGGKTKMVPVTIRRSEIKLDAAYMGLVLRHLHSWGLSDV